MSNPATDYYFGEGARDLPGREILHDFNVLEHRVEDSTHVAKTPDGNYIVRWLLRKQHRQDRDALEAIMRQGGRHLGQYAALSDGAVQVPNYRAFVAESPHEPESPDSWLGGLAIFSVVQVVGSRKLGLRDSACGYPILASARYLRWIYESDTEELLHDLYKPGQFRPRAAGEVPEAWLVDKDELFGSPDAGGLSSAFTRLSGWRGRVPTTEAALEADLVLGWLADRVAPPA